MQRPAIWYCRRADFGEALYVLVWPAVLSLVPIIIAAIANHFDGGPSVLGTLWRHAANNSILMVSLSMLAPTFIYVLKDYESQAGESSKSVPHRRALGFVAIMVLLFSSFISYQTHLILKQPAHNTNSSFVPWFSLGVFGVAILLSLVAMALDRFMEAGAPTVFRERDKGMKEAWQRRREEGKT